MHLINFGVNIQPDPVKFVQINNDFWPKAVFDDDVNHPNWRSLGYNFPEGKQNIN